MPPSRRGLLLSRWEVNPELVTVAYGSTRNTSALHGAEHVRIDPAKTSYRGTGLRRPTYVYTSRLVGYPTAELPPCSGRIIDEMPDIRASLARALGLGCGVTDEPNIPGTNRRGRIVELAADFAEEWDVRHAVVVTDPHYSRTAFHQLVVPLLDDSYEADALDVRLSDEAWLPRIGDRYETAILATPMVSTVYAPVQIGRFLRIVVSSTVMDQLDESLDRYFGL
jgi:hypothetical protein